MSVSDISSHLDDLYSYQLSEQTISNITESIMDKAKEWQSRPLESIYPIVFMDATVLKIRVDRVVKNIAAYIMLGITLDGKKEILGIWILAFALYIRLKKQQQDSYKKSEILMELSKFHNSEMVINNIIHQWKLPLSRIISILTNLEAQVYFGKSIEKSVIKELPEINKNAMLLAQIVQEFYKFNQNSEKISLRYTEILEEVEKMLSLKIKEYNASIKLFENDDKFIFTDRFAIFNISTIIINNFLDIAKIRKTKNPTLTISIKKENNLTKILFEDNCGGVDIVPFEKVFEPFKSISEDKSKGVGLFIAKTLIEEKLQGKLQGYNSSKGAVFEIMF